MICPSCSRDTATKLGRERSGRTPIKRLIYDRWRCSYCGYEFCMNWDLDKSGLKEDVRRTQRFDL